MWRPTSARQASFQSGILPALGSRARSRQSGPIVTLRVFEIHVALTTLNDMNRAALRWLEVIAGPMKDAQFLVGQKRFDQALSLLVIHGKCLMAHPVAGARKELDAILDVLLKILENLEVERTLLDVEIGFLLQRPADAIIDAVPNDEFAGTANTVLMIG
jgi:hypothetical protein